MLYNIFSVKLSEILAFYFVITKNICTFVPIITNIIYMAKQKIKLRSVQSVNMSDLNYMRLHNRMYVVYDNLDIPHIHLRHSDSSINVSIPLTDIAASEFLSFEMSFNCMLNLFSSLCIKFGNIPF